MKKIIYFGTESEYSTKLGDEIKAIDESGEEEENELEFIHVELTDTDSVLKYCYNLEADVIILDFFKTKTDLRNFKRSLVGVSKKIKHFLVLMTPDSVPAYTKQNPSTGEFVYFYKGVENTDIIVYLMRAVFMKPVNMSKYVRVYYTDTMTFKQLVKVRSVQRDFAILETDYDFEIDKMTMIQPNFPQDFFHSHMHRMKDVKKKISSFHFNNIYELEFKYFLKPFKKDSAHMFLNQLSYDSNDSIVEPEFVKEWFAVEKKQKNLLITSDKTQEPEEVPEDEKTDFVKPDEKYEWMARSIFQNYLFKNSSLLDFKTEVLVVYSKSSKTYDQFKDYKYNLYFRSEIKDSFEEVSEDYPSVVVFDWNDFDDLEQIKEYTSNFVHHRNYFPYVLIFNYKGLGFRELQHYLEYHFVIQNPEAINQSFIDKVMILYKKKKIEAEENRSTKRLKKIPTASLEKEVLPKYIFEHEVIIPFDSDEGNISVEVDFEVMSISEFDIVFTSDKPLKIGSIFWITHPIAFQIVIVPHPEGSEEERKPGCFRGIIHCLDESRKMAMRRFINRIYKLQGSSSKSTLTAQELAEIKRSYLLSQD